MTKQAVKYKVVSTLKFPKDAYFFNERKTPKKLTEVNKAEVYPFSKMAVGDSFFIPGISARDMRGAIYGATKRYNHMYYSRTVNGGTRVWRHN